MGDTKVSIKGLHEDMRIFASEVTEESKSATDRVKKLGNQHTNTHIISLKKLFAKKIIICNCKILEKYVLEKNDREPDEDKSRRFEEIIEMVKEDGKNWSKSKSSL